MAVRVNLLLFGEQSLTPADSSANGVAQNAKGHRVTEEQMRWIGKKKIGI